MKPHTFTLTATGTGAVYKANRDAQDFNLVVAVTLTAGSTTYAVEHCYDLNAATPRWFVEAGSISASTEVAYTFPVEAIRINASALSGGNLEVTYLQAGV